MNNSQTAALLHKLSILPEFKITTSPHGGLLIEAGGIKYDGSSLNTEEALLHGYIFLLTRIELKMALETACLLPK